MVLAELIFDPVLGMPVSLKAGWWRMYKISASGKLPMGKPADTLEVGAADIAVCEG